MSFLKFILYILRFIFIIIDILVVSALLCIAYFMKKDPEKLRFYLPPIIAIKILPPRDFSVITNISY